MATGEAGWLVGASRYAVFGMGVSGVAAAEALARRGKQVVLSDLREPAGFDVIRARLGDRVELVIGRNEWASCEVVVASPGMPPSLPIFAQIKAAGVPVVSEVELAFDLARAPFIAITGTDGKTTTTTLVGAIMEAAGVAHVVAGNIGLPLCEVVEQVPAEGVVVAEISAFQLWSTHHFKPQAGAITNVAPDHLDYFPDMGTYGEAKRRQFAFMGEGDVALLNAEDARIAGWADAMACEVAWYAVDGAKIPAGAPYALWEEQGAFVGRWAGRELGVWCEDVATMPLIGRHNRMNMLCAAGLAMARGIAPEVIAGALRGFKPLAHRMERVTQLGQVVFWDDSKATNAHAALAGLRTLSGDRPLVAIVGGVDKGLPLDAMAAYLAARAEHVVLIGQLVPRMHAALEAAGMSPERRHEASSMEDAVAQSVLLIGDGGDVVLSPACSSFDMFKSYAHRGELFQAAVRGLDVDR
jgi:UDP-N-acetylmuramoylalanine--D-glutamate ligase